jgi:hypothetical protein
LLVHQPYSKERVHVVLAMTQSAMSHRGLNTCCTATLLELLHLYLVCVVIFQQLLVIVII